MANKGALATLDDNAAIEELASGVLSKEIAERYDVSPYAVRKRLSKHPDYAQAIKDQSHSIAEDGVYAVLKLGPDSDMVAITRARVKADIALKYAALRNPEDYGIRGNGNVTIDLGSALQLMSEKLQERMQTVNDAQQQTPVIEGKSLNNQ
jgi:hypothetical protein